MHTDPSGSLVASGDMAGTQDEYSVVTLVEHVPDGMRYGGSIGTQGPYPESLAKEYVERAGQQYEPSNGSEGEAFWSWNCCKCERDKDMNGTCHEEGREPGDDDWCPILAASFRGEAKEWVYGPNGQPTCTAFVPMGRSIPAPRCEHTADMFAPVPNEKGAPE
jgi:hypothetical protein